MAEEHKHTHVKEESKTEEVKTVETKTTEVKSEAKVDSKKHVKKAEIAKKDEAIAKGTNMRASKKHCMYICSFIKGKSVDLAIKQLEEVTALKRAIPFKGEIPHRASPGMMSGRFPVSASKEMIYVLKALKGNIVVNKMDIDKTKIYFGSASWASRPAKRGGARFKRTFVLVKAKEFDTIVKENKK